MYKADVELARHDRYTVYTLLGVTYQVATGRQQCTAVTYRSRETNLPIRAILIYRPERVIYRSKRNKEVIRRGTGEVEIFSLYITVTKIITVPQIVGVVRNINSNCESL